MNALVVYDTQYGDTELVAESIAGALRAHGAARLVPVTQAGSRDFDGVDLLVLGCPTQRHGLTPAVEALLDRLLPERVRGLPAAAFDTRYRMNRLLSGSAARSIARRLRGMDARLVAPLESFFVAGREGPLEEGELARAARWAGAVHAALPQPAGTPG
jgi:menaquinone-dependent protoporphyrinogen IX oxidase